MANLDGSIVKHVAKLANLELKTSEVEKFTKQLNEVSEFVRQIEGVDTSKVEPTSQVTGLTNITREDKLVPEQQLTDKEALSGTKKTHNNLFVVPHVFGDKSNE